jgi:hypothetical protein
VSARRRAERLGKVNPWVDPADLHAALRASMDEKQLWQQLHARGIEVQVSVDAAGRARGLLLRKQGADSWLAGTSIDRSFGLEKVQAALQANADAQAQQQQVAQLHQQQQAAREAQRQQQYPRERG